MTEVLPAAAAIAAMAVMASGAVLPFVTFDAYGAFQGAGQPIPQETGSLIQGQDARWVVVVLVVLGVAAARHLVWRYRSLWTATLVVASLAGVALGILEASDSAARVLPGLWGEPSNRGQLAGLGLTSGYYLFLGGAVAALVASLAIVTTHLRRAGASARPEPSPGLHPSG